MIQNAQFRHELKYSIDYAEYLSMRQRVRQIMKPDKHVGEDGCYTVRSIYFDTYDDKALREKVDGVAKREKFRIRYYNDDFSFFSLEKKTKINDLCRKFYTPITLEECRMLLRGDLDWMGFHQSELVHELYAKMKGSLLRPRVLVSYKREPFIYLPGNARVTFDSNIRTTLWHQDFLEPEVRDISATDSPQEMLLEVKYDAYLPEIIQDIVQTGRIRQQAFSKYCACRRFG